MTTPRGSDRPELRMPKSESPHPLGISYQGDVLTGKLSVEMAFALQARKLLQHGSNVLSSVLPPENLPQAPSSETRTWLDKGRVRPPVPAAPVRPAKRNSKT